jgi:hypothetical protein
MPSDRSRTSDDLRQQYQCVVLQQGRVILDRDFNELQAILSDQIAADALDEIGPIGTPDDGFLVGRLPRSRVRPKADSNPLDFALAPGVYYVGGQRAVLPPPAAWSYFHQPDWIKPVPPDLSSNDRAFEAIYLHLFEQEVSAVEDPDLLDVALGGPDTTQRVRLMRRVERHRATSLDCTSAWNAVIELWQSQGYRFRPATMRLEPLEQLQVSFAPATTAFNPCDPVVQEGYLGAENQTIRVQIAKQDADNKPRLLWGYENASVLYRITADGTTTIKLDQGPVDGYHTLKPGQVVEILHSAAKLPDGADLSDVPVPRRVALAIGQYTTVSSFDATLKTLVLNDAVSGDDDPIFLRVWQGLQSIDPASQPVGLVDSTGAASPGILVTINANNAKPAVGSFWVFSVRPSTPQAVYPERYVVAPQPPEGPRQWLAPLATLEWDHGAPFNQLSDEPQITDFRDCRPHFENLVDLSNRTLGGCCTITVNPADAPRLQSMIDSAVADGRPVKVCLTSGRYALDKPLRLTRRHSHLTLESCQGPATIEVLESADPTKFLDGLIVLIEAYDVTVCGLTLSIPAVPLESALKGKLPPAVLKMIESLENLQSMIGIRAVQSQRLTIYNCAFQFSPGHTMRKMNGTTNRATIRTAGAGVFLAGDCSGLRVERSRFESDEPATSTPNQRAQVDVGAAQPPATGAVKAAKDDAASTTLDFSSLEMDSVPAFVFAPPAPTALCGIAALPFLVPEMNDVRGATLKAAVHDAVIGDNEFSDLMLAVFACADLGNCVLRDNRVSRGWGGLWLVPFDASITNDISPLFDFKEFTLGRALGPSFPLPAEIDGNELHRLLDNQADTTACYLDVSNNCIQTLLENQAPTSAALAIELARLPAEGFDTSASAVVSGNELRGKSASQIPVVATSTDREQVRTHLTMTGNVIVNNEQGSPSLLIFPLVPQSIASKLAVTGNVLVGRTNLASLIRVDAVASQLVAPFNTWVPFNSIEPDASLESKRSAPRRGRNA